MQAHTVENIFPSPASSFSFFFYLSLFQMPLYAQNYNKHTQLPTHTYTWSIGAHTFMHAWSSTREKKKKTSTSSYGVVWALESFWGVWNPSQSSHRLSICATSVWHKQLLLLHKTGWCIDEPYKRKAGPDPFVCLGTAFSSVLIAYCTGSLHEHVWQRLALSCTATARTVLYVTASSRVGILWFNNVWLWLWMRHSMYSAQKCHCHFTLSEIMKKNVDSLNFLFKVVFESVNYHTEK